MHEECTQGKCSSSSSVCCMLSILQPAMARAVVRWLPCGGVLPGWNASNASPRAAGALGHRQSTSGRVGRATQAAPLREGAGKAAGEQLPALLRCLWELALGLRSAQALQWGRVGVPKRGCSSAMENSALLSRFCWFRAPIPSPCGLQFLIRFSRDKVLISSQCCFPLTAGWDGTRHSAVLLPSFLLR